MTAEPPTPADHRPIKATGPRRTKPAPTSRTARTADPLEDLREIAEAPGLQWATRLWVRFKPKTAGLLELARREDLGDQAWDIIWLLNGNPVFDEKEARGLRCTLFNVLTGIMTARSKGRRAT